jgi:hypothetical protein
MRHRDGRGRQQQHGSCQAALSPLGRPVTPPPPSSLLQLRQLPNSYSSQLPEQYSESTMLQYPREQQSKR